LEYRPTGVAALFSILQIVFGAVVFSSCWLDFRLLFSPHSASSAIQGRGGGGPPPPPPLLTCAHMYRSVDLLIFAIECSFSTDTPLLYIDILDATILILRYVASALFCRVIIYFKTEGMGRVVQEGKVE
jgi:hypothetical protein